MKNIVVLYASGDSNAIAEDKLTRDDISLAEYLLIPIEDRNRSYVCIKPHKYLRFTKAYIQYTLCQIYNDDINEIDPLDPVTVETSSICDLYGLINSVERISLVNQLFADEWRTTESVQLAYGVCDFCISLVEDNETIYHEEYHRNGTTTIPFDEFSVIKHFTKIYHPHVITDLFMSGCYLGLISGKHIKWESGNRINKYSLIGIACATTSTIIFVTKEEYATLSSIYGITVDSMVFYTSFAKNEQLTSEIINGSCKSINDVYEFLEEVYAENTIHCNTYKVSNGPVFLEIFANISFIMDLVSLFMEALYPFPLNTGGAPHLYDCVFRINFTKDKKNCIMNRSSILSVSDILRIYSLREEG